MYEEKKLTVGLMVAMDKELELILTNHKKQKKTIGSIDFYFIDDYSDKMRLIVVKSGIGKVNAAAATAILINTYSPDVVITSGVCGSLLDCNVNQGDIHITSIVKYHDVWCGHPNVKGQVQGMPAQFKLLQFKDRDLVKSVIDTFKTKQRNVWWGPTVSGDWFVDSGSKAKEISKQYFIQEENNLSVDMESGAIAQVCHMFNVRCISVRIISDALLNIGCKKYNEFWNNAGNILNEVATHIIDNLYLISLTSNDSDGKN